MARDFVQKSARLSHRYVVLLETPINDNWAGLGLTVRVDSFYLTMKLAAITTSKGMKLIRNTYPPHKYACWSPCQELPHLVNPSTVPR